MLTFSLLQMALHLAQTSEQFMMSWIERWAKIVSRICSGRLAERGCPGSVIIGRYTSLIIITDYLVLIMEVIRLFLVLWRLSNMEILVMAAICLFLLLWRLSNMEIVMFPVRITKRRHTTAAHSLTRLLVVTAADGGIGSATRFMVRPRASDSTQARCGLAGRKRVARALSTSTVGCYYSLDWTTGLD